MEMVCVDLAMHLNSLPGESSEGAHQATSVPEHPQASGGQKGRTDPGVKSVKSLRAVAPVWTWGASPFIPLNLCFS